MENIIFTVPAAAVIALAYGAVKAKQTADAPAGDADMQDIARQIQEGAMAFLKREYTVIGFFVAVVAVILAVINLNGAEQSPVIALSFLVGAAASALAGYIGMRVATLANVRTTFAARTGLAPALVVAFGGGTVMGMAVTGLALLGLGVLFIFYSMVLFQGDDQMAVVLNSLTGYSMGASSIALFARVGGGIFTKAADVGADLVGKVEAGLPEDDPRNPAVIADNVGDNVGDVAGMGADLFESYVGAIIGTMVLGLGFQSGTAPILLPMIIAAAGILASIAGTLVVRTEEGGDAHKALDMGAYGAAIFMALATFGIAHQMWPAEGVTYMGSVKVILWWHVGVATVIGLICGVLVGMITSYYCSMGKAPVNAIAEQCKTGAATNIIAGLALGMESTAIPTIVIVVGVIGSFSIAGLYGIAIAALGMLSTTGIQLAVDAFGPIADNAGGIAEMTHQDPTVRERTDALDAVGNTTAAIGKGFAIASAAMTALALFASSHPPSQIEGLDLATPMVMSGVFLGGMLPFVFSSMAMRAVGEAAMEMIEEVRRQFREIPGLLEGTAKPDTARCVDISTSAALKQMVAPGLLAIISPVAVGFVMGPESLGGLLAGVTVTGVLLAIFMSTSGGAWDPAKKSFEGGGFKCADGTILEKGSEFHDAAVVGDTVGDPFKDTAGPSLNILVKLISVVALVIAPLLAGNAGLLASVLNF
ncbi:MAG: sodium-translocating pyrophosphatase [Rhodobacterales bacterium]|nr:sodium-translocating pyrophosphatase [Rhodobacterales bacterium]